MTTRELLASLPDHGVSLTYWRLRGLIDRNEIPRPRMNSSLQWDWQRCDVAIVAKVVREKSEAEAAAA